MKPTVLQRFFADNWPFWVGTSAGSIAMVAATARGFWRGQPVGILHVLWFAFLVVVAAAAGFLIAMVLLSIVAPPFYHLRARLNGAPFKVGDQVLILSSRHRGKVGRIVSHSLEGDHLTIALEADETQTIHVMYDEVCRLAAGR